MIEDLSVVYLIPPTVLILLLASLTISLFQVFVKWGKGNLYPASFIVLLFPFSIAAMAGIMGYGNKQDLVHFLDIHDDLEDAGVEIRPAFSRLVSISREYARDPSLDGLRTLDDALNDYREKHGRKFVSRIEQGVIIDAAPSCFKGEASEYLTNYIAQYPLSTNIMKEKIKRHLTMAGTAGLVPGCALIKQDQR